jgi:hypothetical protein
MADTTRLLRLAGLAGALACAGCSTAAAATPQRAVAPAPPPKDDGSTAQGAKGGGSVHSAALEQLKVAPIASRRDKQNSVAVPLPDAPHWTRVRFLTVPSLVGFRYGKDHHAIVAAFVTHVEDNGAPGACNKSFESWAQPWVDAFDVELAHDPPTAFSWSPPPASSKAPKTIAIVDVDPLMAKTATVLARDTYAAAWAAYPAWTKACLVVGVAVPAHEDLPRARAVRDRFVAEVFPKLTVLGTTEPPKRF